MRKIFKTILMCACAISMLTQPVFATDIVNDTEAEVIEETDADEDTEDEIILIDTEDDAGEEDYSIMLINGEEDDEADGISTEEVNEDNGNAAYEFEETDENDSIAEVPRTTYIVGEEDDNAGQIQLMPKGDEEGYVIIEADVAEGVTFPLTIKMKSGNDATQLTLAANGQNIRVKPGTYKITSVVDGNNKKLSSGATLQIDEDSDGIYLDFTKPDTGGVLVEFLMDNIVFVILAAVLIFVFYKYREHNNI